MGPQAAGSADTADLRASANHFSVPGLNSMDTPLLLVCMYELSGPYSQVA